MMKSFNSGVVSLFVVSGFFVSQASYAANAMLTWISEPEPGISQVNVQRMEGDEWQAAESVYSSRERNFSPSMGSNQAGDIMLVWTATSTVRSITRSLLFRNDRWQAAEISSNQGGETTTPAVIFDRNNDGFFVWVSDHDGLDDVYWRHWTFNTNQWSNAEKVNGDNDVPDILPALTLNLDGDVVVQWQSIDAESGAYTNLSRVYPVESKPNSKVLSSHNETRELNYSDVPMPQDWSGSIGRAVMHFPDNNYIQYEKLPRQLSR